MKKKRKLSAAQKARQVIYTMAWRAEHPEEYKAYQRDYQKRWRKQNQNYNKEWRDEHPDYDRLAKRKQRAKNT